jgi:hypothetical protein
MAAFAFADLISSCGQDPVSSRSIDEGRNVTHVR